MTDSRTTQQTQAPGQLVGLIALSVLALLAALVLGIVGAVSGSGYQSESDLAVVAVLAWWSNFMLTVAVVAFIGTLVLAGVRRMLMGAGLDV